MKSTLATLAALVLIAYAYKSTLDQIFPAPHKTPTSAAIPAAEVPVPGTARPPYVVELQAEIAAREAQLDHLSDQLDAANAHIRDLANTLNSAIAERNEAIALLQQMGAIQRRPNS